jgi:hypothetical protein
MGQDECERCCNIYNRENLKYYNKMKDGENLILCKNCYYIAAAKKELIEEDYECKYYKYLEKTIKYLNKIKDVNDEDNHFIEKVDELIQLLELYKDNC